MINIFHKYRKIDEKLFTLVLSSCKTLSFSWNDSLTKSTDCQSCYIYIQQYFIWRVNGHWHNYNPIDFILFFSGIIGLSIDIFPKPDAVGNIGGNLIITSTIIKTNAESWYSFLFFVNSNTCFATFLQGSSQCKHLFADCPGFGYTCNFTHFNLMINGITMDHDGMTVEGRLSESGNGTPIKTETTIIKVYGQWNISL